MTFDFIQLLFLLGIMNGMLISVLLFFRKQRREAHGYLILLIILLVLRICIFLLGSSSIYDPHHWFYLPSFEFSLAYGPLVYAYLITLSGQTMGRRIYWHLIPVLLQVGYSFILLLLPKQDSFFWIQNIHFPWIDHLLTVLVITSMGVYLYLSYRCLRSFNLQLEQQRSDSENFRFPWIRKFFMLSVISLITMCLFLVFNIWYTLSYDEHLWLFAIQSVLLLYLSLESWKFGDVQLPDLADLPRLKTDIKPSEREKALVWQQLIDDSAWWKNPEFSLDDLASHLGSNTTTVSLILNKGLGKNFNTIINEMRVASVCENLRNGLNGKSILEIAFDMGFNSKNSFNRNFKKITGLTPSQYLNNQVPNNKSLDYVKNGANSST